MLMVLWPCMLQYRDLPPDAALSLSIWELAEGRSLELVGDAAMQLFNKKGRLKTGRQQLKVWLSPLHLQVSYTVMLRCMPLINVCRTAR